MRTMFSNQIFGRSQFLPYRLAQAPAPETAFALSDYLDRIEGISDKKTRDELKAKYEECKSEGLDSAKGLACLAALGIKIAAALESQGAAPTPTPVVPTPQPKPPESAFPIVPVAIGGIVVAGLVAFLATR
jgi:hypothetical protein